MRGAFNCSVAVIKKSGHVNCLEPEGPKLLEFHTECLEWFVKAGWDTFCFRFQGLNYEVEREFAENFDGKTAWVGGMTLHVTEEFMATTTSLPTNGKRWFKNKSIIGEDINMFLKARH